MWWIVIADKVKRTQNARGCTCLGCERYVGHVYIAAQPLPPPWLLTSRATSRRAIAEQTRADECFGRGGRAVSALAPRFCCLAARKTYSGVLPLQRPRESRSCINTSVGATKPICTQRQSLLTCIEQRLAHESSSCHERCGRYAQLGMNGTRDGSVCRFVAHYSATSWRNEAALPEGRVPP